MKKSIKYNCIFLLFAAMLLGACNKDVEQFPDINHGSDTSSAAAIATTIASNPNFSLYNEVIKKSGYADTLNNKNFKLTMFVPGNAAVKTAVNLLTGGAVPANAPDAVVVGFIQSNDFPKDLANGLVKYHTVYLDLDLTTLSQTSINRVFPNMVNPAPNVSPFARLSTFISKAPGLGYVNNVPVSGTKITTGNGSIYPTGAVVMPPRRFLLDRINTDPELTYFKAAIVRADSGLTQAQLASPTQSATGLLGSFGPNLTVFTPTDAVMRATLTGLITMKLVAAGVPLVQAQSNAAVLASTPAVFSNPALYSTLTPLNVKGLIYYHILGATGFSNNFPITEASFPTLISLQNPAAPQLKIKASFSGPMVSALTVKGFINTTEANAIINPLPDPAGSSDQLFANGTLFKIDQVLLPQSF